MDRTTEADGIYTRSLAEYIVSARRSELPADLIGTVKLLVLDALGCGLLGSTFPWTRPVLDTAKATESPGPALIWGHDSRFTPACAAMVNGTFTHGFETDDVGAAGHPGSVAVPTALALAEGGSDLSGLDLIRAIVTGIEVGGRVGACVGNTPHVKVGFHGPGLQGTFTSAATAAAVLRLDVNQCVAAIGTAAQFAGGIMGVDHGGMGKRLLQGKAAHSGTLAAQLAAHGFENVNNIFECGYGSFPSVFCGGQASYDLEQLRQGLGQIYRSYNVNFKMWSCRAPIHPALEAIRDLRAERKLDASQVERIDIPVNERTLKPVGWMYTPGTATSAQMNLQYCLAVMLLFDEVYVDQFAEELLSAPEVLDLVSRIHIRYEPSLDASSESPVRELTLDITLKDGERISATGRQRSPRYRPVSRDEVVGKFLRLTREVLARPQQTELIDICDQLDSVGDARALLTPMQVR